MTQNYYEATGVLVLDHVTPVIRTLFGIFSLRETFDGMREDEAYIAQKNPPNKVLWGELLEPLAHLAKRLRCPIPSNGNIDMQTCLDVLSTHFQVDHSHLDELIARYNPTHRIYLDDLFLLATCFDDGHALTEIKATGAWCCSEPRLFEFGGDGIYICHEMALYTSSTSALELGHTLRAALNRGNICDAANGLAATVESLFLRGFRDDALRDTLRQALAFELLSQSSSEGSSTDGQARRH